MLTYENRTPHVTLAKVKHHERQTYPNHKLKCLRTLGILQYFVSHKLNIHTGTKCTYRVDIFGDTQIRKYDVRSTYYLHLGHVFFPPEVFLVLRSESSQPIVCVHAEVDEGVEQGVERTETAYKCGKTWGELVYWHKTHKVHIQNGSMWIACHISQIWIDEWTTDINFVAIWCKVVNKPWKRRVHYIAVKGHYREIK